MSNPVQIELGELFGIALITDDKLLAECEKLCQNYNIPPQDLFFKWEALSFGSSASLNLFSADRFPELKAKLASELDAKRKSTMSKKPPQMVMSGNRARGMSHMQFGGRRGDTGTPVKPRPGLIKSEPGSVAGPSRVAFKGPSRDAESKRRRGYRYMYEKISERSDALDERIDELAELLQAHYKISELGDPDASTEGDITVVGRITLDADSSSTGPVKLNEASLSLESSRMMGSGARVPLRFSPTVKIRGCATGAGGVGLYPGAIVGLVGKNGGGGWFLVNEVLVLPPLQESPHSLRSRTKPDPGEDTFSMTIASGPFTSDADLSYKPWKALLDNVKIAKPAVLLLLGPFVDSAHPKIAKGDVDETPAQLFHKQFTQNIREFLDVSPDSTVLLVPSTRDVISNHAVFPQCELGQEFASDPRVHLLPNPCRFKLNDTTFAVTSADVVFHFRKEEYFKRGQETDPVPASSGDPGNDPMGNLCRHLLNQRSFYPIFPVPIELSHEMNLDVSHLEGLALAGEGADEDFAPDVLVLPSKLKFFAKVIHNSLAVNPCLLHKGTYSNLAVGGGATVLERLKHETIKLVD